MRRQICAVSPCLEVKCLLRGHDEVHGSESETSAVMCYYHSPRCRPISFPPYHWPSLNNGSCWLKGSSVLSGWMMDAPPVLFHPARALKQGRCLPLGWRATPPPIRIATAAVFLFFSGNWRQVLQLFTRVNNVVLHLYLGLSWPLILIWRLSNARVDGGWQGFNRWSSLSSDVKPESRRNSGQEWRWEVDKVFSCMCWTPQSSTNHISMNDVNAVAHSDSCL